MNNLYPLLATSIANSIFRGSSCHKKSEIFIYDRYEMRLQGIKGCWQKPQELCRRR